MWKRQLYFNVETTSINVGQLNFYCQQNISVETALMNVETLMNKRCFNVV